MALMFGCLVALIAVLVTAGLAIRLLNPLPPLEPRSVTHAMTDTAATPLGRGIQATLRGRGGQSGLHMLDDGREAFAARILLARAATRSLDLQYYIWHGDISGTLMLEAAREAAERGVRVRLLLDDNGIAGLDPVLAGLNLHPHIEIRLFNPFVLRRPKMLGYLADFPRLNRRMHNKSFTADGQVTIIGGRNIGDEYFGARDEGLFSDLDVLAIGPVVREVEEDFDRYWNSRSAYPAERILPPPADAGTALARLEAEAARRQADPAARAYEEAVRRLPFIDEMRQGRLPLDWAPVRMVSDDPAKALGEAPRERLLTTALREAIGEPRQQLALVSGYFVPTAAGVRALATLAAQGVRVSVLTNAFEATDVWIVHAGYAERRAALLRAGVRLLEMRGPGQAAGEAPHRRLFPTGSGGRHEPQGQVLRSSGATLHAKTFAIDRQRLFIGSFNFDPRSMHLNTELGFVIASPAMAGRIHDAFEATIPQRAYAVRLTPEGDLCWHEREGDRVIPHVREPGTTAWQRAGIRILSRLPIEWLL